MTRALCARLLLQSHADLAMSKASNRVHLATLLRAVLTLLSYDFQKLLHNMRSKGTAAAKYVGLWP